MELALVDSQSLKPAMINSELCQSVKDKKDDISIQTELNKFSLEYNGPVIMPNQQPLNTLANEMETAITRVKEYCAHEFNADLIPIGIIPTLELDHLSYSSITSSWRYHAIDKLMKALHNDHNFDLNVNGVDSLSLKWPNTVICGVNNSYQVHLRVNPAEYNDMYNAAQIASAFVLCVSGNSPLLLGHRLWEETRIAIFEQTVNNKAFHPGSRYENSRVSFGRGWIKDGALGLLKDACELFHPILPAVNYDPEQADKTNKLGPVLANMMQHNGSIWPWNRAIYDPASKGHFRIEMRSLSSGPTIHDMAMNAGFLLGLTKGLSYEVNSIIETMAFKYASHNFYQAAQYGLGAKCIWPNKKGILSEIPMTDLLDRMLDLAAFGLHQLGVSDPEITSMQSCIRARYKNKMTGSIWQRQVFDNFVQKHGLSKEEALTAMFQLYIKKQSTNQPVGAWTF